MIHPLIQGLATALDARSKSQEEGQQAERASVLGPHPGGVAEMVLQEQQAALEAQLAAKRALEAQLAAKATEEVQLAAKAELLQELEQERAAQVLEEQHRLKEVGVASSVQSLWMRVGNSTQSGWVG